MFVLHPSRRGGWGISPNPGFDENRAFGNIGGQAASCTRASSRPLPHGRGTDRASSLGEGWGTVRGEC